MNASAPWAPDVHTFVPVTRQPPLTFSARVRTLARSLIRSRVLTCRSRRHTAAAIPGQVGLFLLLGPEPQQARGDLAVGKPVESNGPPGGEEFLDHDEPFEEARLRPPYSAGMTMPTQPRAARRLLKAGSPPGHPGIYAGRPAAVGYLVIDERADFAAQRSSSAVSGVTGGISGGTVTASRLAWAGRAACGGAGRSGSALHRSAGGPLLELVSDHRPTTSSGISATRQAAAAGPAGVSALVVTSGEPVTAKCLPCPAVRFAENSNSGSKSRLREREPDDVGRVCLPPGRARCERRNGACLAIVRAPRGCPRPGTRRA